MPWWRCAASPARRVAGQATRPHRLGTPVALPVVGGVTLAGDLVVAGAGNGDVVRSDRNAQGLVLLWIRRTGRIRWQTKLDDAVLGTIAYRDGVLICPRTGEVTALASSDGRRSLAHPPQRQRAPACRFALTGRQVYAVSSDGYLGVLGLQDGKVLEKVYLQRPIQAGHRIRQLAPPQIVGGHVIVGSETGGLHCLSGSETRRMSYPSQFIQPLGDCRDASLVGGKAANLGSLLRARTSRSPMDLLSPRGPGAMSQPNRRTESSRKHRRAPVADDPVGIPRDGRRAGGGPPSSATAEDERWRPDGGAIRDVSGAFEGEADFWTPCDTAGKPRWPGALAYLRRTRPRPGAA